jgi:sugar phosphate isomerase/epimerase
VKLCLSSTLLWAYEPTEVLTIAADLGYQAVELWAFHLLRQQADPELLAQRAADLNLALSLHALSWDLNFCSPLAPIREVSLDLLRQSIQLGGSLGAVLTVMHPGRITVPGEAPDGYWSWLRGGLGGLAEHAQRHAMRLAFEHMEPLAPELVVGPEAAHRLLAEVNHPNLVLAFDLAHVPWGEDPVAYYEQMPPVAHLHLSDASAERRHLALKQGGHDLGRFVAHLMGHYHGLVVIEGIEHRRTTALAARNKQAWDEILSEVSAVHRV